METGEDQLALIAAIADELPAGVWVATAPDGKFAYANRAFESIMGMGPEPDATVGGYAQPYGIFDRAARPYPETKMPFVRALEAGALVVVDDLVIHRRDGKRVYVRAYAKPMRDASGRATHVIITFFDISREVAADAARDVVEHELRTVLAHAPVIVFLSDAAGVMTVAEGHGLARLSASLEGRSLLTDFPTVPDVALHARRALAGETVRYTIANQVGVFETWLAPTRDPEGRVLGLIGVSTDVTERARAEAQLAQAERLASLGLLAAGVAHEVNNPLAYLVGNLDALSRELEALRTELPAGRLETMTRALADARDGARRVTALARDLRVFGRVDGQEARDVDVRAPLEAALAIAHNELRHRARTVRELGDVPVVRAEEGRLAQVFLNLLVNAAQAIPDGAADRHEIRVRTMTGPDGDACIEVSDTGAGMDEATARRVFDPFFTTKDAAGTGLGLAICHSIVSDLGGTIDVESTPRVGTTFRVRLPPARAEARPPDARVLTPRGLPRHAPRRRVLLVDDELLIVRAITPILADEFDVSSETRADAALARIRGGERFDALVCDLMMPEMSGMDLHAALASVAPDQASRMLFVTGGVFTKRAASFLEGLAVSPLDKPFDIPTLLDRVRAVATG